MLMIMFNIVFSLVMFLVSWMSCFFGPKIYFCSSEVAVYFIAGCDIFYVRPNFGSEYDLWKVI